MSVSQDQLIRLMGKALCDAIAHLEYCGYGDAWEREVSEGLDVDLEAARNHYINYISKGMK